MRLPESVQEIAEVIGRDTALYLVGQLPRCYTRKSCHVILYVPKTLKPDHPLVRLLGWADAKRLADAFGGEILQPASCAEIYRRYRDATIARMLAEGATTSEVAELFEMPVDTVRRIRGKAQEELRAANDNTAPVSNRYRTQAAI